MVSIQFLIFLALLLISSASSTDVDVVTTPSTTTTTTQKYANYGEYCSKAIDCDSNAYLSCINGSCQCALSEVMKFDDATSSCWVLPGEKCIYRASEVGLSLMVDAAVGEERTIRGDRISIPCSSFSSCEDGFCSCDSSYFPTANGTCERQREYEEPCDSDAACRSSLHLICNEGKCTCNETNSVFDKEHGMCVGLSGSSCFDFELCTTHAYCPSSSLSLRIFNQFDVKCTCKPGYFETANKTCEGKKDYGAFCIDQECRDDLNLICVQNKCTCNTTTHLYDASEEKCLSKVGEKCSASELCVQYSDCIHAGFLNGNVLARNMICKCSYGYFMNDQKLCEKKREHDMECKDDTHCREDFKLFCNKRTGLCACNETVYTYDRSKRRCISLAGQYCENNQNCVINSICRSPGYLYPRLSPRAECICKDGFYKSNEGYCLGKYGSRCESWTNSCKQGLTCKNGECSCKYGTHQQYFDYTSETCATYVGAPCSGANDTSCVLHASCVFEKNGPVCRCDEGYIPTEGGKRCAALVGQKCSEGEHGYYVPCTAHSKCDAGYCRCAHNFYHVVENGTCERKRAYGEECKSSEQCTDNYCEIMGSFCSCNKTTSMFDPTRKTCLRLAGAKCYDSQKCVEMSECRSPGRLSPVDMDAICICNEDGYYASKNGTCEKKRGYGEACTDSKECEDSSDLICSVHGRCECNTTTSVFDETQKRCLKLAGAPCHAHSDCSMNAKCRNPLYWVHFETFSPHAKCECEKELGYTTSVDGRCMIDYYGGKCDIALGQQCSSKFICDEKRCLCPYEDHQKYDYKLKSCISLVKGPCDNQTLCTKHSQCVTTEEGVSECRCKHGYIPVNRECELTFGQTCSVRPAKRTGRLYISDGLGEGSVEEEESRCDRLAPLRCVDGTCQCGGFQFYDYENQKCRGLVGSKCVVDAKGCTEGSYCEAYRSLPPGRNESSSNSNVTTNKRYGRCKCMQGYVTETNRTCTRSI